MKNMLKVMILVGCLSPNFLASSKEAVGGGVVGLQPCNNTAISPETCSYATGCSGQRYQKCFNTTGMTQDIYCKDGVLGQACSQNCGGNLDAESQSNCTAPLEP